MATAWTIATAIAKPSSVTPVRVKLRIKPSGRLTHSSHQPTINDSATWQWDNAGSSSTLTRGQSCIPRGPIWCSQLSCKPVHACTLTLSLLHWQAGRPWEEGRSLSDYHEGRTQEPERRSVIKPFSFYSHWRSEVLFLIIGRTIIFVTPRGWTEKTVYL